MQTIASKDNQQLKLARSLRQKKGREDSGLFLIEGLRLTREALLAGVELRQALFGGAAIADPRIAELARDMEAAGCPCAAVDDRLLAQALDTGHPQGVAAIAVTPASLPPPPAPQGCYACADRLADPGNLGTIMRSARAARVSGLVLTPGCADPFSPKVVRSAMGAAFRLPIATADSEEQALSLLRPSGARILVAAAEGRDVRELTGLLQQPHCWILGSEAEGASPFWREHADQLVSLPMAPDSESLNVAAAAAVLFYQSYFAREL